MEDFIIPCPSCGATRFEVFDESDNPLCTCQTCGFGCCRNDLAEHGRVLAEKKFVDEAKKMVEAEFKKLFK